mgnify:CR=1 FL=1
MNKGIFAIPIHDQDESFENILNEVIELVVNSEKFGLNEAFFGEHITDRHERITSSLMMVSALSKLTSKIKLGTLTTNLNFYNPAVVASAIAMADNLTEGRLILGIGCGANGSDLEAINLLESENHKLMLESYEIINQLLKSESFVDIKSENYKVSTAKTNNKELGLGFFNRLYKNREDLEIIMPALNKNSYNVQLCAKNNWSIVISNFCSNDLVDNHINNYLKYSNLEKKEALKKIKLSRLIYVNESNNNADKLVFSKDSPFMKVTEILFKKLKTFNKHHCFGENINTPIEAAKNTILYGSPDKIKNDLEILKQKYGDISSIIYVSVPKTKKKEFDNSLELFSKYV